MSNIDTIKNFIEKNYSNERKLIDETELSLELNIWPSDIRKALKKLCETGFIVEDGKRFRLNVKEKEEINQVVNKKTPSKGSTAFQNIIGINGSLKNAIQMAKAAIMYPPNGLHTLIIGESGVGKSTFAEEMWKFANEFQSDKEIPFVLFNCAEYADNPQLLLSHLFGHVKGAFTGAVSDSEGLVEKANNGVLFLDEIHRLSSVGQEMFFTLIDKGIYRRLGETTNRTANLMIIGATTENPNSVMLQTFRRRIPVNIVLPTLIQRPISERIELINYFLSQEANRLQHAIHLTGEACKNIIFQDNKANIGDLKNTLQLCCAKSYCSYLMSQSDFSNEEDLFVIDVDELPFSSIVEYDSTSLGRNNMVNYVLKHGISVYPGNGTNVNEESSYEVGMNLYSFVEEKLRNYQSSNETGADYQRRVINDLERYYRDMLSNMHTIDEVSKAGINSIICEEAQDAAELFLSKASEHFNRKYSKEVYAALAYHMHQLKERIEQNIDLPTEHFDNGKWLKYEDELAFINPLLPQISNTLKITIPPNESAFLAMFIHQSYSEVEKHIGIIIVAHGESTATSMADFVNKLLNTSYIKGINAPIEKEVSLVIDDIVDQVKRVNQGKGVILLTDMGSYVSLKEDIEKRSGTKVEIIPNVSTVLCIEAAKNIISNSDDLRTTYEKLVQKYIAYLNAIFDSDQKSGTKPEKKLVNSKPAGIVVCSTGLGSAKKLADIISESITELQYFNLYTVSIADDINSIAHFLGNRLKFVAGNFNPGIASVPFFSTESILMGNGISNIRFLIENQIDEQDYKEQLYTKDYVVEKIAEKIDFFAPSFNKEDIMTISKRIALRIETEIMKSELATDVYVRILLHNAALMERLLSNDVVVETDYTKEWLKNNEAEALTLKSIINKEYEKYNLSIPDGEIVYFIQVYRVGM